MQFPRCSECCCCAVAKVFVSVVAMQLLRFSVCCYFAVPKVFGVLLLCNCRGVCKCYCAVAKVLWVLLLCSCWFQCVFTFLKMASMDGVCLSLSPALFCRSSTDSSTLKQGFDWYSAWFWLEFSWLHLSSADPSCSPHPQLVCSADSPDSTEKMPTEKNPAIRLNV